MIPILKNSNEETIAFLVDALSCTVTEERNGTYELELTYPITGVNAYDITVDCIILAKPNETSNEQLFRVYEVSKPISGIITIMAEHISYCLAHYPVAKIDLASTTAQGAIQSLISNTTLSSRFSCNSDITYTGNFSVEACTVRSGLGGIEGSVLDVFGGEYEFDNYTIYLHKSRGADNGVTIAYGKNLTDCTMVTNIESTYTHFFPYAYSKDSDGNKILITLSEKVLELGEGFSTKVLMKDFTERFGENEEINEDNLRSYAYGYFIESEEVQPSINLTISFEHLWQSPEYSHLTALEKVSLCDTVHVYHEQLGVDVKAKVIKTVYDVLGEKYEKIEIGNTKSNFADTIKQTEKEIETIKKDNPSYSQITKEYLDAIDDATKKITGNKGGYVVLTPPSNPQELLIMNMPDIDLATKVWRFNLSGLGYSSNGYTGRYKTAITMDGKINADFITTGTLTANIIRAGTLASTDYSSYFNLENGYLSTSQANITGGYISIGSGTYRTVIADGALKQYLQSYTNEIGGIVPIGNGSSYNLGIYCHNQSLVKGVSILQRTASGTFESIVDFLKTSTQFYSNIYTNRKAINLYAALTHYRTTSFSGNGDYTAQATFGCGNPRSRPSAAIECRNYGSSDVLARLDVMQSYGEAYVILQGFSCGMTSKFLELGSQLWWGGIMNATRYDISSTEDIKEDIKEQTSVLNLFKTSKIYNYKLIDDDAESSLQLKDSINDKIDKDKLSNLKEATQDVKDKIKDALANSETFSKLEKKTSVGFVIGRETPKEVISEDKKHIDLYSMVSITWKAVQELLSKIENIETQINELKEDSNGTANQSET